MLTVIFTRATRNSTRQFTESWYKICEKKENRIKPTIWHTKKKSVLKFHPSGMYSCWEILDEYLFKNLGKNKNLKFSFNRTLKSNSYKKWILSFGIHIQRICKKKFKFLQWIVTVKSLTICLKMKAKNKQTVF